MKRSIFSGIRLKSVDNCNVRYYRGTTRLSTRNSISWQKVSVGLCRLDLKYDRTASSISPIASPSRVANAYARASDLVDKNGDLIRKPPPKYGCFGAVHWRAMSLVCGECPHNRKCTNVVTYRLMFGGEAQFRRVLQNAKQLANLYDENSHKRSQGYEFERDNSDVCDLKVLYYAYWRTSDLKVRYRLRWRKYHLRKAKERERGGQTNLEKWKSNREKRKFEFDKNCSEIYGGSIESGVLEEERTAFEKFKSRNSSDRKWRQLRPGRLAIVKVCLDAVRRARNTKFNGSLRHGDKSEVHAASEDLLGIIEMFHPDILSHYGPNGIIYGEINRHLNTLEKIRTFDEGKAGDTDETLAKFV